MRPRRLSLIPAWFAAGLLLAACGDGPSALRSGPTGHTGDVDLAGGWLLEFGAVGDKAVPLVEGHRITAVVEGDQLGGTAACNAYSATVDIDGSAVSVRDLAGTAMGCAPPVMRSEEAYLSALRRVDAAARDGGTLVLTGSGTRLRFTALPPPPVAALVDTRWVLTTLVDGVVATSAGGDEATLVLSSSGRLSASTGCRTLRGRYVVSGDEFTTTQLSAEGHCPTHLHGQDDHVAGVLGDGFRAEVAGRQMTLTSDGHRGLVYRSR